MLRSGMKTRVDLPENWKQVEDMLLHSIVSSGRILRLGLCSDYGQINATFYAGFRNPMHRKKQSVHTSAGKPGQGAGFEAARSAGRVHDQQRQQCGRPSYDFEAGWQVVRSKLPSAEQDMCTTSRQSEYSEHH